MSKNAFIVAFFTFLLVSCLAPEQNKSGDSSQFSAITKVQGQASETECSDGGVVLNYGIDENGNGTLDDDEVDGSETVCHGEDGTNGENGANGSSCTLSDNNDGTSTLSCPDGTSVTIESAPADTGTTLQGSFNIENAADIEWLAQYTSVSGTLRISNFADGLSTISLPNLESVGELWVQACQTCTELSFPALTQTGDFTIQSHDVLANISFPVLASVDGNFIIKNNPLLPTNQIEDLRDDIEEENISGTISICGNKDGGSCGEYD
ncbi:MAG: hypothetical protein QGI45_00400 [Myxococcota bacterium]|jgi:hypothetical protein|nr:hypothetical protein [Myxococcota bacterium]